MRADYQAFLTSKAPRAIASGVSAKPMPSHLFDYQKAVLEFAIEQGRCGTFLDTGLGKTAIQLEFCKQGAENTNGRALILTPLAVARQIEKEGKQWGYECRVIREQSEVGDGINICNYDRLEKLDLDEFGTVSLDESSILKSFTGKTTRALINAFNAHRFRMAATATPAPNDQMEIGQHAEFLGVMGSVEMLSRFFINDTSTASQEWRLKRHGEAMFWDWMASWSRMAGSPEDMGFDGSRHVLPPLNVVRHRVDAGAKATDGLFAHDTSATGIHTIKRQTCDTRANEVARIVYEEKNEPWVIWCDTDYEADALKAVMPDAIEVRGSHKTEQKEERLAAFSEGQVRVLISKPSVCGFGMNWQHAARQAFVGRSFSYEAWYQAVRRSWRFGQKRQVDIHLIVAEGEDQIGRIIDRKSDDHAKMKASMRDAMKRAMGRSFENKVPYEPTFNGRLPRWLNA